MRVNVLIKDFRPKIVLDERNNNVQLVRTQKVDGFPRKKRF